MILLNFQAARWTAIAPALLGNLAAGLSIPALLGVATLLDAAMALHLFWRAPEFGLRFQAWLRGQRA